MTKKQQRQKKLLETLKSQGTGVVSISDETLSTLLSVSKRTISDDIKEMDYKNIIVKETRLITKGNKTYKQRDIIVPGEPQRRFTLDQHRFLSNKENHDIFVKDNEVIWMRRPNGITWERSMCDKTFVDKNHALSWLYNTLNYHRSKYIEGDRYTSRGNIIG